MARFGDMLYQRRRQLGLSIQQVANTIKIRPQIIEYFENGDFASIPPRGYAQGMISSYARYLGLNPREVVESYFEELRAYELATSNHGGRFQDPAGMVSARSDSATGRFMMVESAPRSRYAQRPPQAGYVSEVESGHEPQRAQSPYGRRQLSSDATSALPRQGAAARRGMSAPLGGRPYRSSGPVDGSRPSREAGSQGYRAGGGSGRPPRTPYGGQRTGGGRPPQRGSNRGGRGRAPQNGVDQRLIIALIAAAAIIIVLLALLLIRGCAPSDTTDTGSAPVSATSPAASTTEPETTDEAEPATDGADATSPDTAETDPAATTGPQQTVVRISVAKGESSWLEVRLDGSIVYGDEVVGPFEQEYTVTDSIRITANTPSAVTVTQNGETVRWDTSTSGVARINITAPETPATTDQAAATDGTATTDGAMDDSAAAAQ